MLRFVAMLLAIAPQSVNCSAVESTQQREPNAVDPALYAWFRADQGLRIRRNDKNQQIAESWMDQSKHGRHLTAAKDSRLHPPALIADSVSGKPTLRFDGAACLVADSESFGIFEGAKTIFVVALVRNAEEGYVYDSSDAMGRNTLHTGNGIHRGTWDVCSGALHGTTIGPAVKNNTWQFHTVVYDHKQNRHAINGAQVSAGDFEVIAMKGLTVGCRYSLSHFIDADIAELLFYRDILSESKRHSIEAYLSAKYRIERLQP